MGGREGSTEREVASSPGPTQILSRSHGEKSPQLRDKIWVGPGDEAKRERRVGEEEQQRERRVGEKDQQRERRVGEEEQQRERKEHENVHGTR